MQDQNDLVQCEVRISCTTGGQKHEGYLHLDHAKMQHDSHKADTFQQKILKTCNHDHLYKVFI